MSGLRPRVFTKALTEEAWSSLRQVKIYSVTDFVSRDGEDTAQTPGIAYKDVVSIGHVLLAQFAAFPVSALQLYINAVSSHAILTTGVASLDELLDGGLYAGELCELTGEAASGKTQVCLRCAVTVAKVHGQNTVYIDTCGSFSAQTVLHLIPDSDTQQFEQSAEETLSRISCIQVHDIYSLLSYLDHLSSSLKTQVHGSNGCVKLVVIDCIAAMFSHFLGGQQMDSQALIEQLGQQLKCIAVDFSVAVLVTNNLVSAVNGGCHPCLGRVWDHVPHVRVLLERDCTKTSTFFSAKATIIRSVRMTTSASAQIHLGPIFSHH